MYGIYNALKKQFQFGIKEPTVRKAEKRLFEKIGKDAYKWRFEVRKINENAKPVNKKVRVSMGKKIVQIAFAGNNEVKYDFFTDLETVQVGDPVVCDTVRGYSVGKVAGFVETSTKATNWIVQRVDVEGHKARLERERLAKELAEMLG